MQPVNAPKPYEHRVNPKAEKGQKSQNREADLQDCVTEKLFLAGN